MYEEENRNLLSHPINTLMERLENRNAAAARARENLQDKNVHESHPMNSSTHDNQFNINTFLHSTVEHLIRPMHFLKTHKDCLDDSSKERKSNIDDDNIASENSQNSLYESFSRSSNQSCACENSTCQTAAKWYEIFKEVDHRYVFYSKLKSERLFKKRDITELRRQQHQSYKWLLNLLHQVTFSSEILIEIKAQEIEELIRKKIDPD